MTTLVDILKAIELEPPDLATTLAADVADTTTTTITAVTLPNPVQVGAVIEVDNELMRVRGFSRSGANDVYTVLRGVDGSTAATHLTGVAVYASPKYPRWKRIQAVNRVYTEWVPLKLPRVLQDSSQVFSSISSIVAVPAGALNVLEIGDKPPGFTDLLRIRHGRPRPYPTTLASTGRGVRLFDIGFPGQTVYVTYTAAWGPKLAADADVLPTDWVFGEELLATGAAASLLGAKFSKRATFDAAHTQRAEDKAGQSQMLTREARREAELGFQTLLAGYVQDWWGAQVPTYWEG